MGVRRPSHIGRKQRHCRADALLRRRAPLPEGRCGAFAGRSGQNAIGRGSVSFDQPLLQAGAYGRDVAVAVAACGSHSGGSGGGAAGQSGSAPQAAAVPQAHPQAIEPTAGVAAAASAATDAALVGNVNAHAPSLAQVKRELKQLNLCGGATSSADATPLIKSSQPGFIADPGTSQTQGQLPVLTAELNALGSALGVTIYGISGYRSPAHSVAVGGYANDPHTQGKAEDIGVNSLLRSSAAQISEAELARFNLYRPFDPTGNPNNSEVNHIQLIPSGGPLSLAQATSTWDPDPSCK